MEPTRPTVLCDPVTAARASFATLGGHPSVWGRVQRGISCTIMYKEAWINLRVAVLCEACHHAYSYPHKIREGGGGMRDVQGRVERRFMEGDYGYKACPKCGYLQSWMLGNWRQARLGGYVVVGGILFVAAGRYFVGVPMAAVQGSRFLLMIAAYALVFVVGG